MAKKGGINDKLGKAKDAVQDFAEDALHQATNIPKNAANKIGKQVGGKIDLTKQKYDHSKAKPIINGAAKGLKDFAKSKDKAGFLKNTTKNAAIGAKNGIKSLPGKAWNNMKLAPKNAWNKLLSNNNIRKTYEAITHAANFVVTWWKVIATVGIVVIIGFNVTVIAIGIAQSVSNTPHYYCDLEANRSIKNSSVYQQYCKPKDIAWTVDNINGHYIVQDGKGPATACAMANMILRFYSIEADNNDFGNTNVYKYLWQADGQYNINGGTLGDSTGTKNTIRQILNHYNEVTQNEEDSNASMTNGSRQFAASHEKNNYDMSNWGYLRDESIDMKAYAMTKDFYDDQTDNEKWVWDLSLDNKSEGTTWELDSWDISFKMNSIKFNVEQMTCPAGDKGYAILKNRIISIFTNKSNSTNNWQEYYSKSAGVMVEYSKVGGDTDLTHTILITKVDLDSNGNPTMWYGVDSSLGTSGGWEGPMDGTGRFIADDTAINTLLNSPSSSISFGEYTYTLKKIGYCVGSEYGFY